MAFDYSESLVGLLKDLILVNPRHVELLCTSRMRVIIRLLLSLGCFRDIAFWKTCRLARAAYI